MDSTSQERLKKKFDVCYLLPKENMAFVKYPAILELEERLGIDIGFARFCKNIYLLNSRKSTSVICQFFSFLMDGSTDTSNTENELIMIVFCKKDDDAQEVKSCIRYVSVEALSKGDAEGLIDSLNSGLWILGIENLHHKELVLHVANQPVVVGGGISKYSTAKWHERKVTKGTSLAVLDMVFCTQVRASMQECIVQLSFQGNFRNVS